MLGLYWYLLFCIVLCWIVLVCVDFLLFCVDLWNFIDLDIKCFVFRYVIVCVDFELVWLIIFMAYLWRSILILSWYWVEPYVLLMMCVDLRWSYVDVDFMLTSWFWVDFVLISADFVDLCEFRVEYCWSVLACWFSLIFVDFPIDLHWFAIDFNLCWFWVDVVLIFG